MEETIKVYIKPILINKHIIVNATPTSDVGILRGHTAAEFDIPAYKFILTYAGKYLEDGYTLAEYGITNGSIVRMIIPPPY